MRLPVFSYIILLLFVFCIACGQNDRTKTLTTREQEIENKEQQLQAWEEQLRLKEQDLAVRERIIDSLNGDIDTTGVYNPAIVGSWMVTMECIETTCEGSAIGDTKTEQWDISYQNNQVVAKAIVNKKLIRTYTGYLKENILELITQQTSNPETHMNVVLNTLPAKPNLMEGQRVISQGGKCRIVYKLKAEKL